MNIEELVKGQDGPSKVFNLTYFEKLEKETHPSIILLKADEKTGSLCDKIKELLPLLDEHSILLIDGIRTNDSVFSDWKQLQTDTTFHFSADVYQFGLLAIRSFQEKEHFVLRY